jgi:hypothetical protein
MIDLVVMIALGILMAFWGVILVSVLYYGKDRK